MRAIFALFIGLLAVLPLPVSAQIYSEPGRGTATRSALMDAIRSHVEWDLGQPIEFVVDELRVAGDVAYRSLSPQRPGGGAIDLYSAPGYRRGMDPEYMDGTHVAVLYRWLREMWVVVCHSIGGTDDSPRRATALSMPPSCQSVASNRKWRVV